ncbi:hypothetical protein, partial [Burkholderia stagnalis]|uniref:hypothetical protein n=1 Tax=Burkholderia stagnalis TaxID=1503054 RepID=UPI001C8A7CDB
WRLYADHHVAPLRRSRIGSIAAIRDNSKGRHKSDAKILQRKSSKYVERIRDDDRLELDRFGMCNTFHQA